MDQFELDIEVDDSILDSATTKEDLVDHIIKNHNIEKSKVEMAMQEVLEAFK